MRGWTWWLVAALVVPSGAALAQDTGDPLRPEIAFPDVEHEGRVIPLGDPGELSLNATIGCQKTPFPTVVRTDVRLQPKPPSFANAIVSPVSQTSFHDPARCSQGRPLQVNATFSVSLTQNAPAYETFDVPVEMTVQRSVEGPVPPRTYTEQANGTFTAGYHSLVNVRATEKIAETAPGGNHTFEIRLDNFSNGPTEFRSSVENASEGVAVDVPEPVVLETQETARLDVHVQDTSGRPDAEHPFTLVVNATSTDPSAEQGNRSEVGFLLATSGTNESLEAQTQTRESSVPAPGVGLVLAAVAGLALLVGSSPKRR